jgi:pyruvate/2-oxoglutarate dehydrogenase complex dihydrolipoamide acyltransferase (E2) component
MKRSTGFKPGPGFQASGFQKKDKPAPSPFEAEREAARRKALNALKRAKRAADKAGIVLSDWEGEFIEGVSERIQTYGRAFGDPEKGAPGQALSSMQGRKLKEITAKANGEEPKRRWARKKPAE